MKYILIILSLFNLSYGHAQFLGGNDDGDSHASVFGTQLNGDIVSYSIMYRAGNGDGHDVKPMSLFLNGNTSTIYKGGLGDGFSKNSTVATISGYDINSLYFGNSGDGFSQENHQTILNGLDLAILFSGNSGDGADNTQVYGQLLEGFISIIFEGGIGDGFANNISTNNFLTGVMLLLYQGGSGDGFAVNIFTTDFTLDLVGQLIKMDVFLYPNPASQIVTIIINDNIIISSVEVYDISGKKINMELSNENSLNVSNLADGIYLLNIFSESGRVTKRLIVKK